MTHPVTPPRRRPAELALGAVSHFSARKLLGPAVVVAGAAAAGVAIWTGDPRTPGGPLPTCPTKAFLGVICPGCGSLRAVDSLLHGDLLGALGFNALGVVGLALLLWSFVAYCTRLWTGRRIPLWSNSRHAATVLLVAVTVWFVARNLPVEPFLSLRV